MSETNSEYDLFLDAIAKEPHDWFPRLVFADWLIEQGDPHGEMVHVLYDLLQLDCEDRETKQTRYLELYHEGHTIPTPTRNDNAIGATLVLLPPGQFLMGSPKDEEGRNKNEKQVEVTLTKGFWIGQTVVTQSQWKQIVSTQLWINPQPWEGKWRTRSNTNDPATGMDHSDASVFCRTLTKLDRKTDSISPGWTYQLPTEAQWEFACRSGTRTRYSFGDLQSSLDDYAWCHSNPYSIDEEYVHEVACKKPNPWNLYDMHGNVREWCLDRMSKRLPGGQDPIVAEEVQSRYRVTRGGSWNYFADYCRSSARYFNSSRVESGSVGFRICLISDENG